MKIVVISTPVFQIVSPWGTRGYAGLEVVAYYCARGLAARGHTVKLVAPDGSDCPGVEVVPIGPAGQVTEEQAYGGFPKVEGDGPDGRKVLKRREHAGYWQVLQGADVVIDHSWSKWSMMLKAEGLLKAPCLSVLHAPVNTMYRELPPVEHPCFVCISQDQCDHFNALFSPRRARVCHNGIDLDFYKPLAVPRTERFLFLARFSSIKGPDLAVDTCRELGQCLDLVGDTSITNEPELFESCARNCDGKRLLMVGPCSRGNSVYWFGAAHALLHPNLRFREPLGLAPLEAQACGSPVIAFDHGAMRETVRHGETGFLCDPNRPHEYKEWVSRFNDRSAHSRQVMRETAVDWAQRWGIDRMVDRYQGLCEEALDSPW